MAGSGSARSGLVGLPRSAASALLAAVLAASLCPAPGRAAHAEELRGMGGAVLTQQDYPTSGMWGSCPWELDVETGVLTVRPGIAERVSESMAAPWSTDPYYNDERFQKDERIRQIVFEREGDSYVVLPGDCSGLFYGQVLVGRIDFTGADTSRVRNWTGAFEMDASGDGYGTNEIDELVIGERFAFADGVARPEFSRIYNSDSYTRAVWYGPDGDANRIVADEFWARFDPATMRGTWTCRPALTIEESGFVEWGDSVPVNLKLPQFR